MSAPLRRVAGPAGPLAADAVVGLALMRDEADILPAWLSHGRALGVARFHVIDHESRDATPDILAAAPDVALWRATGSYAAANCGLDWLNAVGAEACAGRWTLTLDADEFLIAPALPDGDPAPGLAALTAALRREGALGLYAAMVDLHPEAADAPAAPAPDLDTLLRASPLLAPFDAADAAADPEFPYLTLRHGARARLAGLSYAPRAQKIPLAFWRPGFRYVRSTHAASPIPLSDRPAALAHFRHRPGLADRLARDRAAGERLNEEAHAVSAALLRRRGAAGLIRLDPALPPQAALRAALAAGGWRGAAEGGAPAGLAPRWAAANRSRAALFDLAAGLPPAEGPARDALARAVAAPGWRWSAGLRRRLAAAGLLHPDHRPETDAPARDPLAALVGLYESLWWDLGAPLRLPRRLAAAIRWRALWRRLAGRRRG